MISETDRKFLQSLHICPDIEVRDRGLDLESPESPESRGPDTIIISATLARDIIEKYGELNWQTFVAYYRTDKTDGQTNSK